MTLNLAKLFMPLWGMDTLIVSMLVPVVISTGSRVVGGMGIWLQLSKSLLCSSMMEKSLDTASGFLLNSTEAVVESTTENVRIWFEGLIGEFPVANSMRFGTPSPSGSCWNPSLMPEVSPRVGSVAHD